jgi:hypothetical protein
VVGANNRTYDTGGDGGFRGVCACIGGRSIGRAFRRTEIGGLLGTSRREGAISAKTGSLLACLCVYVCVHQERERER